MHTATVEAPTQAVRQSPLARQIDRIGAVAIASVLLMTVLSFLLMAIQPEYGGSARQVAYFADVADRYPSLPGIVRDTFRSQGPFSVITVAHVAYVLPLFAFTLCGVGMLNVLYRHWRELTDADARRLLRWAIAFAVASVPAYTVMFQDIWLSVVWGRMINDGVNPYAIRFPLAYAADLPLDHPQFTMTYGPLWAAIASTVTYFLGSTPMLAMLALKLVLLVAWVASLWLVADLTRGQAPWRRCVAIAVMGWLPIGVHSAVSEAHNDIVMIAFMLLWMRLMRDASTSALGPLALAASVASKYVTAPLALIDVIANWQAVRRSPLRYLLRILPALVLMMAMGVFLVYSGGTISETSAMQKWRFLDPSDPFHLLRRLTGLPFNRLGKLLCLAFFGLTALWQIVRLARHVTPDNVLRAQLSIMALVMLVGVGHVWPWFFVWCLPLAALAPNFWLSWFIVGASLVAPFTVAHWSQMSGDTTLRSEWPSVVMYGMGIAAVIEFHRIRRRQTAGPATAAAAGEHRAGERVASDGLGSTRLNTRGVDVT